MVINIPSESEASEATIIYGCPISEEVEIQSTEVHQLKQPPDIDSMERNWKQQRRQDGHATIPTLGSHAIPNQVQRIPIAKGL